MRAITISQLLNLTKGVLSVVGIANNYVLLAERFYVWIVTNSYELQIENSRYTN